MDFLDEIDDTAKEIGAVNTIHFIKADGHSKLYGYNTDIIGFTDSLTPQLRPFHKKALILGTGGASKAVEYSLHKLDIETQFVSRTRKGNCITYDEIDKEVMNEYLLIVNCSPVGMFPNIESAPSIPYDFVTDKHYLYDLVYNPTNTKFCEFGKAKGAITKNGLDMLHGQAIASWKIWNK